jgi:uncharacterized membrane protein YhaH (DUF805 family)
MKWYFRVLRKYAVFTGRAGRKEYWIFGLIHALIVFGLQYPHFFGTIDPHARLGQIEMLYLFGTLIPLVAVSVRRLHDINRSGWWSLLSFIPLLNLGLFFGILTRESQAGENRYGPNPQIDSPSGAVTAAARETHYKRAPL